MADPQAEAVTQLRNIQTRTGKTIAQLHKALVAEKLAKHGEKRSWLMQQFQLGYGDANAVALWVDKPLPDLGAGVPVAAAPTAQVEALDAITSLIADRFGEGE